MILIYLFISFITIILLAILTDNLNVRADRLHNVKLYKLTFFTSQGLIVLFFINMVWLVFAFIYYIYNLIF
jgi:hypothetical protein